MSTVFTCRWAECRLEFKEEDRYKEHINSHVESLKPMLVSNIPDFRRAAGFGPASSASQSKFDYLNTQDSFLKGDSAPEVSGDKMPTRKVFSALGLGGQATPPMSPVAPSPSMSAQIRGIASPFRKTTARWSPPSPIHGLASTVNDGTFATPSSLEFSPAAPQDPSVQADLDNDDARLPTNARSLTPDDDASTGNPRKRKQSVLFNEPTTPANKKKKKNPKTPYPDPDLDSSDEDSDHQGLRLADEEIEALANPMFEEDPYLIQTQVPTGSSWDGMETPEEEMAASFFLRDSSTQGAFVEEVEEELEVATQLSDSGLHPRR